VRVLFILSLTCSCVLSEAPNLVPGKPAGAPNYWCTWYAQNYWIQRGGEITDINAINNLNAREELNEETVFNPKDGWASTYLPRGRSDYIFLIDHGWQDKRKEVLLPGATRFFSLQMDFGDFPRFRNGDYAESLRLFNREIKKLGWRGLGLWVRGNVSEKAARRMVEWSKHADIRYWKIDGGGTKFFHSYWIKKEIFPELVLEYVSGSNGPINPGWDNALAKEIPSVYAPGGAKCEIALKILQNCDVFRTYDAAPILVSTTTMRRVHDILSQTQGNPKYIAVLNVQDDPQVAAGLGCLVAAKRHPNYMERTLNGRDFHHQISGKRMIQYRMNEVERFGRWARIAPAFPAGIGSYCSSEKELIDSYPHDKRHTWYKAVYGKMVYQSAPAVMARNMPLPVVEAEGDLPHVMASTYPNGPLCVAVEGRVRPDNQWFEPRAKVTVQVKDANEIIGVFGHYKALALQFAGPLHGVRHVWAQDLLADQAEDILSDVSISGNTLTIPGWLIDLIGTSAGDEGDISVPGMVLRLEGDSLPVADADYTPKAKPFRARATAARQVTGLTGSARLENVSYGYRVTSSYGEGIVLWPLQEVIDSGRVTITWKMKPFDHSATRNGFLVLSSGREGINAVLAGSWIGSNQITVFEQSEKWGGGKKKKFRPGEELDCRAELDMDARTLTLTINGTVIKQALSESITTVDHIGFGVKNARTLFSKPTFR